MWEKYIDMSRIPVSFSLSASQLSVLSVSRIENGGVFCFFLFFFFNCNSRSHGTRVSKSWSVLPIPTSQNHRQSPERADTSWDWTTDDESRPAHVPEGPRESCEKKKPEASRNQKWVPCWGEDTGGIACPLLLCYPLLIDKPFVSLYYAFEMYFCRIMCHCCLALIVLLLVK